MKKQSIRVRLAPSPTGNLHIGTARTGVYNWLFAKQNKGSLILRIEDTDSERSKKEYEKDILEGLRWLGVDWDELYHQSERLDRHQAYLQKLLDTGAAFYCFATPEELETLRTAARTTGKPFVFKSPWRDLPLGDAEVRVKAGERAIIRLRGSDEPITFTDIIRGDITIQGNELGDFSIAKSIDQPLYNLAVVADDHDMKITHVIRGEDHINNTPKQLLIMKALGISPPQYAHVPLLLNADRSKMSKRKAAVSVAEYKNQGYTPDALFNFLTLLGWHPKGDEEILSRDELIKQFDLSRVQKGGAVFDVEKLRWMNGEYYRKMTAESLAEYFELEPTPVYLKIIEGLKHREGFFTKDDIDEMLAYTKEPQYDSDLLVWKKMNSDEARRSLEITRRILESASETDFLNHDFEKLLSEHIEEKGKGFVFWPLRIALSGKKTSPSADEIKELLTKDEVLARLSSAIQKLSES